MYVIHVRLKRGCAFFNVSKEACDTIIFVSDTVFIPMRSADIYLRRICPFQYFGKKRLL